MVMDGPPGIEPESLRYGIEPHRSRYAVASPPIICKLSRFRLFNYPRRRPQYERFVLPLLPSGQPVFGMQHEVFRNRQTIPRRQEFKDTRSRGMSRAVDEAGQSEFAGGGEWH